MLVIFFWGNPQIEIGVWCDQQIHGQTLPVAAGHKDIKAASRYLKNDKHGKLLTVNTLPYYKNRKKGIVKPKESDKKTGMFFAKPD